MKDIVIVGAGKIGSMIAELLGGSGDYSVTVVDRSQHQLDRLEHRLLRSDCPNLLVLVIEDGADVARKFHGEKRITQ